MLIVDQIYSFTVAYALYIHSYLRQSFLILQGILYEKCVCCQSEEFINFVNCHISYFSLIFLVKLSYQGNITNCSNKSTEITTYFVSKSHANIFYIT